MGKPVLNMIYMSGGFSTHLLVNKIFFDSQKWENQKEEIGTSLKFVAVFFWGKRADSSCGFNMFRA